MKSTSKLFIALFGVAGLFWLVPTVLANGVTVVGTATASARSSTWIAVEVPFTGDENGNGYTIYEIGTSSTGPFSSSGAFWPYLSGSPEWRANVFAVSANTTYFIKVTFVDPDGVAGTNPQIVGPVTTPATSSNAVTVEAATVLARDTEIYVSVPILNDANRNSGGTIDVATSPSGPWTRKCGSPSEANLPFHPKRGRIPGLTPGTDYWIRVTITDPEGVAGTNPQIVGPIHYSGLQNLALGKSITADPGWGCCPNPAQLVDGRIQNDAWFYGFAWTGGNSCWAGGCPPGFKQATIDLGVPTTFNRAIIWYHDPSNVPIVWKFQSSNDGVTWTDAYSNTDPICRTATIAMPGAWYYPACGHDATFSTVTARYFRYTFDDRTLFGGIHGWAVEVEVYNSIPPNQPPDADAGEDQTVECTSPDGTEITLDGSGSSDPDNDQLTYTWRENGDVIAGPATNPTAQVTLGLGSHTIELTVDDGNGGVDTDEVTINVVDTTPPTIAVDLNPDLLWPPNHKLKDIHATVTVSDACDANPNFVLTSIVSDEPDNGLGDGDKPADIQEENLGTADVDFKLRAERAGNGDGRVYIVTYTVTDASGNSASVEATVTVPHDMSKAAAEAEVEESLPENYALYQNHPNPFNPDTEIRFQIPEVSHIVVKIFNIFGEEIRMLVNASYEAGYHRVRWDGKDKHGKPVASGVYLYQLQAGEFSQVKKMSLLR